MMAGGSNAHIVITGNIFLSLASNSGNCTVRNSDQAVSVAALNAYYFPDLTATCQDPEFEPGGGISRMTNPELIVEVLSNSTAEYDLRNKFSAYRKLDSFKEYILIDSREMRVDTFYREANDLWHIRSYYSADQVVEVRTLGINVNMLSIYKDVVFEE